MALSAGHRQSSYSINVARADVSDPNDLLAVVATWPEVWHDHYREREAIMAINANHRRMPPVRIGLGMTAAPLSTVAKSKAVWFSIPPPPCTAPRRSAR